MYTLSSGVITRSTTYTKRERERELKTERFQTTLSLISRQLFTIRTCSNQIYELTNFSLSTSSWFSGSSFSWAFVPCIFTSSLSSDGERERGCEARTHRGREREREVVRHEHTEVERERERGCEARTHRGREREREVVRHEHTEVEREREREVVRHEHTEVERERERL